MAHDGVVAVRDDIDEAVIELQGQLDGRIPGDKPIQRRPEMQYTEADGAGNTQGTGELAAPFGELRRRFVHVAQDLRSPRMKRRAVFRQQKGARRAVNE